MMVLELGLETQVLVFRLQALGELADLLIRLAELFLATFALVDVDDEAQDRVKAALVVVVGGEAEEDPGDELAGAKKGEWTPRQIELLTATGFLRMAADGTGSGTNNPEGRNQVMIDTLKIVGSSRDSTY